MTTIIGISGSLRRHSFNSALLRAAASLVPDGTELRIKPIADIPLYNADVESEQGIPAAVTDLKDSIAASDGLIICTPEYNNSVPGVLKNTIDWLSRPPKDIPHVFGGLPVAVMGASAGRFGTVLAQSAWLPTLRTLGTTYWSGGRMLVPSAATAFDQDGTILDDSVRDRLRTFIQNFSGFCSATHRESPPPSRTSP